MEFIKNILPIILITINIAATMLIKFNDFKHMGAAVDKLINKVDNIIERVSKIEGYLDK